MSSEFFQAQECDVHVRMYKDGCVTLFVVPVRVRDVPQCTRWCAHFVPRKCRLRTHKGALNNWIEATIEATTSMADGAASQE